MKLTRSTLYRGKARAMYHRAQQDARWADASIEEYMLESDPAFEEGAGSDPEGVRMALLERTVEIPARVAARLESSQWMKPERSFLSNRDGVQNACHHDDTDGETMLRRHLKFLAGCAIGTAAGIILLAMLASLL